MAVYRVDVQVDDPYPVFDWLEENVTSGGVVRKMAYKTVKGWYLKIVFKNGTDAERFHRHWLPEQSVHTVKVFGS